MKSSAPFTMIVELYCLASDLAAVDLSARELGQAFPVSI